jgi:shikimate kinase
MTQARFAVPKTVVLVGLMGAGKSCVGRRLANVLALPFCDADKEIEEAAGCSIPELFDRYGEAAFRDGERRVIHRLLEGPRHVLATGGGAFMDARRSARTGYRSGSGPISISWSGAPSGAIIVRCSMCPTLRRAWPS